MNAIIFVKAREQEKRQEQIDKCHKYAKDNGMKVVGVYDNFVSMLEIVTSGKVQKVIVTERSRISRDSLEYTTTKLYLSYEYDVQIIALNEVAERKELLAGINKY